MSAPGVSTVKKAVAQRASGDRPGPLRAFGAAVVVGVAAGVLTYRMLRSGSS
jgi:hypothetical protein